MKDVLLLNMDFTPLGVLAWQRAVCMVLDDKVQQVATYAGLSVRAASLALPWPAVVSLRRYVPVEHQRLGVSRANLFARDAFSCQYCGWMPADGETTGLTIDHVVPRVQARDGYIRTAEGRRVPVNGWENLVTACRHCNAVKGSKTPERAGLRLRRRPGRPGPLDAVRILFGSEGVEQEWLPYLPSGVI